MMERTIDEMKVDIVRWRLEDIEQKATAEYKQLCREKPKEYGDRPFCTKEHTYKAAYYKIICEDLPLRYEQEQADIRLLAEIMYHENWSTDKDHKAAYYTGAVILNRVTSKEFPDTIRGVIYQTKPCKQYAVTDKIGTKELPQECIDMAADLIRNGAPDVPENVVYQATFYQGSGLWKSINGEKFCFE